MKSLRLDSDYGGGLRDLDVSADSGVPAYRQNCSDWTQFSNSAGWYQKNWICNFGMPRDNPFAKHKYPFWHWRPHYPLREEILLLRNGEEIELHTFRKANRPMHIFKYRGGK